MSRSMLQRAADTRQLDLFAFTPVLLPVDRSPPLERGMLPLHLVPLPVLPVIELPEVRLEPERPRLPEPPKPLPFSITEADHLGEGSLRQKCENNLAAIKLLKCLETEGRPVTEAEQRTLVRYVGWGGLPQVFDAWNDEWKSQRERLEQLLTPDELASARATTLNAHYTSATIIRAMYAALEQFGFTGGRVLEPACGLGHFLGLMPEGMRNHSSFTGIEIDSLTARLAKALYPKADIRHVPFEEAKLADDFYDVVISNVPFGDYRPYDPRYQSWRFLIHDYFFAAALAKARPGGMVAFITSRGTFDKQDTVLREFAARQADLIGAIRLPDDAFKRNANTEVTTDMVFLRKRLPDEPQSGPAWKELLPITNSREEDIQVNEFYAARPGLMLGEMQLTGRMYREGEPSLVSNGRDLGEQLRTALEQLPRGVFQPVNRKSNVAESPAAPLATSEIKPNAFCLHHGQLARREGDSLVVLSNLAATTAQRLRGLINVRDALRECLRSQWQDQPEEELVSARGRLNLVYEIFVQKFGPLSDRRNAGAFRGDPDLPLLLSIEHYDRETGKAAKAAIFRERTIAPKTVRQVTDGPSALLVSLSERGRVDPEFLAGLLRQPFDQIRGELAGLVFLNPQSQQWETDDAYLSGNVREKLRVAEAAVLAEPRFAENVTALQAVQPEDLPPAEIDARLGSAWVPEDVLVCFAEEILGEKGVEVRHAAVIGAWVVRGDWNVRGSVANTTEWGTDRRSALELIEDALNLRVPSLYDPDPEGDKAVLNAPATEAAREKQQKLKERFQSWVWENDQRCDRLSRLYNDQFNNLRLRTFNGDHLVLPGASAAVTLKPHQKAAVWRILQTPNTLLAHVVGAGKTYAMTAAAMELKRLGLARKPLFVVPNHMLEQFSSELLTLYPAANLLVARKEDFTKERRQTLMSRIATGAWDAVIVTHSGFERIPTSIETRRGFFEEHLAELSLAVAQQRQAERDSRIVKELEKAKKRLETKLKELTASERKDKGLTFEELGVDRLFVDEAHIFKNLFYVSKMTRIAGLPQTSSQRALDMFLKVRHIQQHGGGVVLATGTPIANSVAEMFTMQRYLQTGSLRDLGVGHFDAWAGTFGEPVTAMELSPDGAGYRMNTRFARFINVPELMAHFRQVADIQTAAMLKLPIPELRGGRPTVVRAHCSPELKAIVNELVARADRLRTGQVNPREDNMLLVTTDGRKAALDLRIYDAGLPDHPYSKLNLAVTEVERIWRDTAERRSAQLVFCDLSTPNGKHGFNVYGDMREKLVMKGIPETELAFIQDFDSDEAKAALFRDVRLGRVRVLFGSTAKMGSGTNVQQRLVALHHLDAPWRPADVEQREGRILRQGNLNPEVRIYRYVTAESFDAYMWQTLETKAKFIAQVMTGDTAIRRLEDIDGAALTYAEVKAIASGNPLVIEKANVDAEVARLTRLRSQHVSANYGIRTQVRHLTDEIPRLEKRGEALRQDLLVRVDTRAEQFRMELSSETITDRGIAGELLNRLGERLKGQPAERRIGRFAGFDLCALTDFTGEIQLVIKGAAAHTARLQATALGTTRALEHVVNHLEETLVQINEQTTQARKRLVDLREQADLPFEHGERLAELMKRQQELVAALDLNKNQAKGASQEDNNVPAVEIDEEGVGMESAA